jgi:hypothetical protein
MFSKTERIKKGMDALDADCERAYASDFNGGLRLTPKRTAHISLVVDALRMAWRYPLSYPEAAGDSITEHKRDERDQSRLPT